LPEKTEEKLKLWDKTYTFTIVSSALLFITGLVLELIPGYKVPAQIILSGVVAISGYRIIKRGFISFLREKRIDINLLITIAATEKFIDRLARFYTPAGILSAVAVGDMGLSLAVILNSLRIGRITGISLRKPFKSYNHQNTRYPCSNQS